MAWSWHLFLFVATAMGAGAANSSLEMRWLDFERTGARCGDGGQFGYYVKRQTAREETCWIVYMEGGGYCLDAADCFEWSQELNVESDSSKWPSTLTVAERGFFDAFDERDCALVYVPYCTFDMGVGNATDTDPKTGRTWWFRGHANVRAAVSDLLDEGMGSSDLSTTVMVAGSSAGGVAAMQHAGWIRSQLSASNRVVGLADTSWFLDQEDYLPFRQDEKTDDFWASLIERQGAIFADRCILSKKYLCIFAEHTISTLSVDFFFTIAYYDLFWAYSRELEGTLDESGSSNEALFELEAYGASMKQSSHRAFIVDDRHALFATTCPNHIFLLPVLERDPYPRRFSSGNLLVSNTLEAETWSRIKVEGTSLKNAILQWWDDATTAVLRWADDCGEVLCNPTCASVSIKGGYDAPAHDYVAAVLWSLGLLPCLLGCVVLYGLYETRASDKYSSESVLPEEEEEEEEENVTVSYYDEAKKSMDKPTKVLPNFGTELPNNDGADDFPGMLLERKTSLRNGLTSSKGKDAPSLLERKTSLRTGFSKTKLPSSRSLPKLPSAKSLPHLKTSLSKGLRQMVSSSLVPRDTRTFSTSTRLAVHVQLADLTYRARARGRKLLSEVTLTLPSNCLTGILGPSGAGKSTLLDLISMRRSVGTVRGSIMINGINAVDNTPDSAEIRHWFKSSCAVVPQIDVFHPNLTVWAHAQYFSFLILPCDMPADMKLQRAHEALALLNLEKTKNTLIGDGGVAIQGGLSGGQRRRLSVFQEILHPPLALLLDEPTSSLDATSALNLMCSLERIRKERRVNVVLTIHQPRTEIWVKFDRLVCLIQGRVAYSGVGEQCHKVVYEAAPESYRVSDSSSASPADLVLDQLNHVQAESARKEETLVNFLQATWHSSEAASAEQAAVDRAVQRADSARSYITQARVEQMKAGFVSTLSSSSKDLHSKQKPLRWVLGLTFRRRMQASAAETVILGAIVHVLCGGGFAFVAKFWTSSHSLLPIVIVIMTSPPVYALVSLAFSQFYLLSPVEDLVFRRELMNGHARFLETLLSFWMFDAVQAIISSFSSSLVVGFVVGLPRDLHASFIALFVLYAVAFSATFQALTFRFGLGCISTSPKIVVVNTIMWLQSGVVFAPPSLSKWARVIVYFNPYGWITQALARAVVYELEPRDGSDISDGFYDYLSNSGPLFAWGFGAFEDYVGDKGMPVGRALFVLAVWHLAARLFAYVSLKSAYCGDRVLQEDEENEVDDNSTNASSSSQRRSLSGSLLSVRSNSELPLDDGHAFSPRLRREESDVVDPSLDHSRRSEVSWMRKSSSFSQVHSFLSKNNTRMRATLQTRSLQGIVASEDASEFELALIRLNRVQSKLGSEVLIHGVVCFVHLLFLITVWTQPYFRGRDKNHEAQIVFASCRAAFFALYWIIYGFTVASFDLMSWRAPDSDSLVNVTLALFFAVEVFIISEFLVSVAALADSTVTNVLAGISWVGRFFQFCLIHEFFEHRYTLFLETAAVSAYMLQSSSVSPAYPRQKGRRGGSAAAADGGEEEEEGGREK